MVSQTPKRGNTNRHNSNFSCARTDPHCIFSRNVDLRLANKPAVGNVICFIHENRAKHGGVYPFLWDSSCRSVPIPKLVISYTVCFVRSYVSSGGQYKEKVAFFINSKCTEIKL